MRKNANSLPARRWEKTSSLRVVSRSLQKTNPRKTNPGKFLLWLLLAIAGLVFIQHLVSGDDETSVVIIDEAGNKMLSPARQAKLDKELEEIDNAKQYALIATESQYYPCPSCPNGTKVIFLNAGEVWRYGVTRIGESGRYPNKSFGASDLVFVTQFEGTYSECLKMEKIKIYNYPLLPEALQRNIKLIRPPGNAYDS